MRAVHAPRSPTSCSFEGGAQVSVLGPWPRALALAAGLHGSGVAATFVAAVGSLPRSTTLLIALVASEQDLAAVASLSPPFPWFAWLAPDASELLADAYRAGASAVFPAETPAEVILRAIHNHLTAWGAARGASRGEPSVRRERHRRGERIVLTNEATLEVAEGVIALTVLHPDGAEVLLGLFGPGSLLTGHSEDGCFLELVAHTEASVVVRPWSESIRDPDLATRLRARLRQMEAWAAAQARPFLEQRVLGILALLAEQFGHTEDGHTVIDLRITHAQLAATVGATRTTVTRILLALRRRGVISIDRTPTGERLCLHFHATTDHLHI